MKFHRVLILGVVLAIPGGIYLWWSYPGWIWYFHSGNPSAAENKARQAMPYQVVYEDNGSFIQIAVPADINEEQLRATLVKVANERQDDPARDYLMSEYLWIEARLIQGERQSKETAGSLARYVPWTNPEARRRLKVDRSMFDKFSISLDRAKRSL
jgi:hypothetical protein